MRWYALWILPLLYSVFPPQFGELLLYHIIDDAYLLIMMDECRLHGFVSLISLLSEHRNTRNLFLKKSGKGCFS